MNESASQASAVVVCDLFSHQRLQQTMLSSLPSLGFSEGDLINSDTVVQTIDCIAALKQRSKADAVGIGSHAIAGFAHQYSIPFVTVRGVAVDSLPSAALKAGQSSVLLLTLFDAVRPPNQWSALIKTAKQFNQVIEGLRGAVNVLHGELTPPIRRLS